MASKKKNTIKLTFFLKSKIGFIPFFLWERKERNGTFTREKSHKKTKYKASDKYISKS